MAAGARQAQQEAAAAATAAAAAVQQQVQRQGQQRVGQGSCTQGWVDDVAACKGYRGDDLAAQGQCECHKGDGGVPQGLAF